MARAMNASLHLATSENRARDIIEIGMNRRPYCRACGEPTTVVEHHDGLWLECVATPRPNHRLLRLLDGMFGVAHDRQLLIDGVAA